MDTKLGNRLSVTLWNLGKELTATVAFSQIPYIKLLGVYLHTYRTHDGVCKLRHTASVAAIPRYFWSSAAAVRLVWKCELVSIFVISRRAIVA